MQMVLSPRLHTILEITRIPPEVKVGIWCKSPRFARIIMYNLYERKSTTPMQTLLAEDGKQLEEFLKDKGGLIVAPNYLQFSTDEQLDWLREFERRGGKLISFDYQIERGSMIYIEGQIKKIAEQKKKDYATQ